MKHLLPVLCVLLSILTVPVSIMAQINTNQMIRIGRNALYLEDYVMAIQHFNQVIKAKPYLAEPYLYRAIAKYSLDDFTGAENDLTLCLERNPFLVQAYLCRGASRQNLGDYEKAIADYTQGLKSLPEDKQMLLNLSIAYAQTKQLDAALKNLDALLAYQPNYPQGYLARGSVYVEQGDTLQAFADYNKALELDKNQASGYAQRGMLYLQQENYAQALQDYNQAILLASDRGGYYINRGLIKYHLNDLRGAMADYDKVISMETHNQLALYNRALLRSQVGDTYGAIDDFNKVIEWEPDNFMAMYNLALQNNEAKNYREAVALLDKVLKEYPIFVPAYYARAELKRKIGDLKGYDKDYWYAYDLEQKLQKQKAQGLVITGKTVLPAGTNLDETAENGDDAATTKTREKSDKNINKFNRLVVADKIEEQQSKYTDELRGRVQDRDVTIELMPAFDLAGAAGNANTAGNEKADFNRGYALNMQKDHAAAILAYTDAIQRNPEFAEAYYNRGLTHLYLGENELGIADMSKAGELGVINAYSVIKKMTTE
ncbi:MAG: tetratricopeptide repeat protein [Candidatus Symbiothrix sp.]|jgi:tetratricopeptide (TPR) repeat protein|nr:tetratricopeptide repeat protein [Candidatus Symbiothrix sp.]